MPMKSLRTLIAVAALAMLFMPGAISQSFAGARGASQVLRAEHGPPVSAARQKVLATIEGRMSDEKALEKVREKIEALDGRRLRLAAALCDRIGRDEASAEADIAFSLVTALIILS
jgi:hypothetical protein